MLTLQRQNYVFTVHIFLMKNLLIVLFLGCIFIGCKKKDNPTPVVPPIVVDPDPPAFDTPFSGVPATKDMVMYEVNMRAFSQAGDFKNIQARLDSVKSLGVNVLWLMPIHPVGQVKSVGQLGSPYSVQNYTEVNPEFGTLADLQTLVKEAHNRQMSVIIDWVANHTAWDNPWISKAPEWYTRDAAGTIQIPAGTNWQDVADLNFDNATMRKEMIKSMKYWVLRANIDGFRCDAADFVPYDFWKQAIDTLNNMPNRKLILLAEGGRANHFTAGFQMNYGWDFFNSEKGIYKNGQAATALFNTHKSEYSNVPTGVHKLRFTTNHDESAWDDSPINLFVNARGAIGAFVLSSYLGGVPLIYNGQEVGRADKTPFFSKSPINWSANPNYLAEYKQIMAFRQANTVVREGSLENFDDTDIAVFKKKLNNQEVLVMVNTRNAAKTYTLPSNLANTSWKNAFNNGNTPLSTSVNFGAYEYLILKNF